MASVFISYRREDSAKWADKLYGSICARYGRDLVFVDVESIPPGGDWFKQIIKEVNGCEVFLALIGPDWLNIKDEQGRRRIDDENDVLRKEVIKALEVKCTFIPVLVGGAKMPPEEVLQGKIALITKYQAVDLQDVNWNDDVKELIEKLRDLISLTRGSVELGPVQQEAYQLQLEYFNLLEKQGNPAAALECAQKLSRILDRHLPLFPYDTYLKTCRGFSLKNEAMALRSLGRNKEFGELLGMADRIFQAMRTENLLDADAWCGSGSIEALRGNFETALEYINKCLEINPNHEGCLHDRQLVQQRIGQA